MEAVRIALVDDEELFLQGLYLLLSGDEKINIVASCNSGKSLLDKLSLASPDVFPDVVLLDIQMEPMNGFELVAELKDQYPNLYVIVLSSHYKQAMLGHMIRLGVSAFLPKNSSRSLLVRAIEKVNKNGVFFTEQDHVMLASFVKSDSKSRYFNTKDQLSDREIEVLRLICEEYTNQEIGDKLFLSKRTVEGHRQRILEKIGARNTAGLVIYGICNDLFRPDSKKYL